MLLETCRLVLGPQPPNIRLSILTCFRLASTMCLPPLTQDQASRMEVRYHHSYRLQACQGPWLQNHSCTGGSSCVRLLLLEPHHYQGKPIMMTYACRAWRQYSG